MRSAENLGAALGVPIVMAWMLAGCGEAGPARPPDRKTTIEAALTPAPTVAGPVRETANPSWRVLSQMSAHHMLVLKVEAERIEDARRIAVALCEPLTDRYAEMLVYFYRRQQKTVLASRRVQWTREAGYVEMDYERN